MHMLLHILQGYFSEKGRQNYEKVMVEACRRAAELLNAGGRLCKIIVSYILLQNYP